MQTAIDTQARINAVYREALVSALAEINEPINRESLNQRILGGTEPAEVQRMIVEPYVPALAQLVLEGTVVQFQEGCEEGGQVLFALAERVSQAERDNCLKLVAEQGPMAQRRDWDNPSEWRHNLDKAVEMVDKYRKFIVLEFIAESDSDDLRELANLKDTMPAEILAAVVH